MEDAVRALQQQVTALTAQNAALEAQLRGHQNIAQGLAESEDIRVKHAHDGTGQPVESSSASTHIVKEHFVPAEHRDIASFNADNEFNRATDEENIDFNISGCNRANAMVKRSHGRQRSKFD